MSEKENIEFKNNLGDAFFDCSATFFIQTIDFT